MVAANSQTLPKCLPPVRGQGADWGCGWMNGCKFILTTGKANWNMWSMDSDVAAVTLWRSKDSERGYYTSLETNGSWRGVRNCSMLLCRVAANYFRKDLHYCLNGKQVTSLVPPILQRLCSPAFQNCRLSPVWIESIVSLPKNEMNYFWVPLPVQRMDALSSRCDRDIRWGCGLELGAEHGSWGFRRERPGWWERGWPVTAPWCPGAVSSDGW